MRRDYIFLASFLLVTASTPAVAGDGSPPPKTITTFWNFAAQQDFIGEAPFLPQADFGYARVLFPPCLENVQSDCIQSLEYTNAQGKWVQARFHSPAPLPALSWSDPAFREQYEDIKEAVFIKERPEQNYPNSGRVGIWELPQAPHRDGSQYALSVVIDGESTMLSQPLSPKSQVRWNRGMFINLATFDEKQPLGGCGGAFLRASFSCPPKNRSQYPVGTKFRIELSLDRTSDVIDGGWLLAQLINSQVATTRQGSRISLKIEGSPVTVGQARAEIEKNETNFPIYKKALSEAHKAIGAGQIETDYTFEAFMNDPGSASFGLNSPGTLAAWQVMEDSFEFKYVSPKLAWNVEVLRVSQNDKTVLQQCGGSSLSIGMVASNASAMRLSPPEWNPDLQELTYAVAAPHLNGLGSINVGVYELNIDSKLGKCLWGTEVGQGRASISVLSSNGEQKIATAQFQTREGMVTFRAAGFTYSTSRIKIALTNKKDDGIAESILSDYVDENSRSIQSEKTNPVIVKDEVSAPPPAVSTQPIISTKQKQLITCIKGSKEKKIVARNPKCPKGWKTRK